ncbi:diacylglycerol kinase family protein [Thermomicrobium sp. 4228-Ro]|uniref:diacylglycerol/lipid kinase family protein n=1 Tax=Thermomicrobium sp. 4228-Ro TaxID=2993937 RepID=UPI002249160A|nr:diacylglycerol kinase family protein [Thermomicrobium sp. 4228-Ro]MCX2726507.1 diacylglycerol kinase family protein [Thermomicrobium sp. 4228-Ro]
MRAHPSLALIANAGAGRVRASTVERIARVLARRFAVTVEIGRSPEEIYALARRSAGRADLVVAFGGDGTASRVAAAVAGSGSSFSVLPGGSTNHVVQLLGLPADPIRAAHALTGPVRYRRLDVGRISADRVLLFLGGVGIDAEIVADASPGVKRFFAWRSYLIPGLRHLGDGPWSFTIEIDGARHEVTARTVLVANGSFLVHPYFRLGPDIDPSDGSLDVLALTPGSLAGWVEVFTWAALGRLWRARSVRRWRGQQVSITPCGRAPVEVDGDPYPDLSALSVTIEPAALTAVVPAFSRGVGEERANRYG